MQCSIGDSIGVSMWNLQIWQAVLADLWHFLMGTSVHSMLQLPPKSAPVQATIVRQTDTTAPRMSTPAPMSLVVPTTPDERYVTVTQAPVSISPYQGFDTACTTVRFGEAVTVRAYHGPYAQILTAQGPGWVHKDVLEPARHLVWPNLTADVVYEAESVATQLIRRHLQDAFNAAAMQLPLQSVEYISYRLRQLKRVIHWGPARPRLPGLWQQQLKGQVGIHIGVQPLADSIMEYRNGDHEGVLMYVEAVAPDNTLTCTTVGLAEAGKYTSHIYAEATWREWRPVFIDVLS